MLAFSSHYHCASAYCYCRHLQTPSMLNMWTPSSNHPCVTLCFLSSLLLSLCFTWFINLSTVTFIWRKIIAFQLIPVAFDAQLWKGIWGLKSNLLQWAMMKYQCNIYRDAWKTSIERQYDAAILILFVISTFLPFPSLAQQIETAVAGVILGSSVSHLQISLCSFSDAISGPCAHETAWLRVRQGLGEPWQEEGRGEKCRAAFSEKHWPVICLHTAVNVFQNW